MDFFAIKVNEINAIDEIYDKIRKNFMKINSNYTVMVFFVIKL